MGLLEIGWFVRFISCFPGIDGDWIWLLDIGLATGFVSWIWEEHEEQTIMFLRKNNEKYKKKIRFKAFFKNLIYFLFKFYDMAFKTNIKMLMWHLKNAK